MAGNKRRQLKLGGFFSVPGNHLAGARGHFTSAGTPEQIADLIEDWFTDGAADGVNIMPPLLPIQLDVFAAEVVPLLRRRGLFRTEYEGKTFRENLGVPIPPNIHTKNRTSVQVNAAASND